MFRPLLLLISFLIAGCSTQITPFEIDNPASDNGKYPRLFTDNIGTVFMSWYEEHNDTTRLYYSAFENNNWADPELVSASDNWFVNWADFPSIIGVDGNSIAAHWLQKKPGGTYSYDVNIGLASSDFTNPITPHNDETPTEHGFASMIPVSDSTFYAVWLDGRNMDSGHGHDHSDEQLADLSKAMTLRGALIDLSGNLVDQEIDPSLCECCNTSLVKTNDGLLVAYRDRTQNEVRDIYVSNYSFQTNSWSEPNLVHNDNWKIAACPVNGPSMDAVNNKVAIAWFTGANDQPVVKLSFSSDAGITFADPIIIDNAVPIGRVDVVAETEETAWVSWITRSDDSAILKLAEVSSNTGIKHIYDISEIDPSRSTGFPQITRLDDGLMLAWTDISGENPRIITQIVQ